MFDTYEANIRAVALTADAAGFLYVGLSDLTVHRYIAGDPGSKELLASEVCPTKENAMTMSRDQTSILLTCPKALWAIDVKDGAITHLGDVPELAFVMPGVAVAPARFIPVPSASEWGTIGMTLCLLTVGTLVLARRSRAAHVANPCLASSKHCPPCPQSGEDGA